MFLLGQYFAKQSVSMETVVSPVFFFHQSKQIQNEKVWSDCHMINYLL